jgi:hypothetical protein
MQLQQARTTELFQKARGMLCQDHEDWLDRVHRQMHFQTLREQTGQGGLDGLKCLV